MKQDPIVSPFYKPPIEKPVRLDIIFTYKDGSNMASFSAQTLVALLEDQSFLRELNEYLVQQHGTKDDELPG